MEEMNEMTNQRIQAAQFLKRLMYNWGYDKSQWPEDFEAMFWRTLESYPELNSTLQRFYDTGKLHGERMDNREL